MALFRLTDDQVKTAIQILSNVSIPVNQSPQVIQIIQALQRPERMERKSEKPDSKGKNSNS